MRRIARLGTIYTNMKTHMQERYFKWNFSVGVFHIS